MSAKIPVVICIDIEPDPRELSPDRPPDWEGFEDLSAYMSSMRRVFAKATGSPVRFNWFVRLDPQVAAVHGSADWPIRRFRAIFDRLLAEGDALGLHTHLWRFDEQAQRWYGEHGDPAWVEHCVRMSYETFVAAFGVRPKFFRFGDRFMSEAAMRLLDRLGIVCDLSVEPGLPPIDALGGPTHYHGENPDYAGLPRRPYRPARASYRRTGWWRRRIWELPLSSAPVKHVAGIPPQFWSLQLGFPHVDVAKAIIEQRLRHAVRPHLVAVTRSDIRINLNWQQHFEGTIAYLADHPLSRQFVLTTPDDAIRRVA